MNDRRIQTRISSFSVLNVTRRRWLHCLFIGFMFSFLLPACYGQGASSAVLGGKVFDVQRNVIAGATVVVTSDERGMQWTTTTNNQGSWRLEELIVGHYRFKVSAPGFKTIDHSSIELQIGDQKFVDVTLEVGSANEKIVVEATTPLIDLTAGVSGTVIDTAQLEELPSQTNSPVEMARLTPGVILGPPTGGTAHLWGNTSESNFTVNGSGQGVNAVNYQIDGGTDTDDQSGIAYIPPTDSIAEIRVSTNAYDASIGRTAAGTIEMSVKSGTEKVHGTLYEMNQNNFLNARSYADAPTTPVPRVRYNEYGGTVGGPVWVYKLYDGRKRGTFFFFNWDGIRNSSPDSTGTMSLPTEQERQGDFSASFVTQTVNKVVTQFPVKIYDPLTYDSKTGKRQLIGGAGTTIPSDRINSIAKAYFKLMPLPNRPSDGTSTDSNNYQKTDPRIDKFANWSLRLDQAWNSNHHTSVGYRWNKFTENGDDPFGPDNILSSHLQDRENWGLTLDHSWIINSHLVLDNRANLTAINFVETTKASGIDPTKYGFSTALVDVQQFHGLPSITGIGSGWDGGAMGAWKAPIYRDDRLWEINSKLTQITGNHSLRYGVHYLINQQALGTLTNGNTTFGFGTNWTTQNPDASAGAGEGSATGSFLLGMPTSGGVQINATSFYTSPFLATYFQDDWRIKPGLTFNLGMRWDYQGGLVERHDRYWSRYDPYEDLPDVTNYILPKYAALITAPGTNLGARALAAYRSDLSAFHAMGAIHYAGVNGTSRAVNDPVKTYLQPRLGFAYQFRKGLVLRGGVGRFVETSFATAHANQDGYTASTSFQPSLDNFHTVYAAWDNPFPNGLTPVTGNANGIYTNVGSVTSYYTNSGKRNDTWEASLHLQHQLRSWLLEFGGTLNLTRNIIEAHNDNGPISLDGWRAMYGPAFDTSGRPLDTLPASQTVTNPFKGAPHITNGLQNNATVPAYQLLRRNPLVNGAISYNVYDGHASYNAMQLKAERRFKGDFGILANFTWGKQMSATQYFTSYIVSQKYKRVLSGADQRFQIVISPTYVLPFGNGKLIASGVNHYVNAAISGWELSGIYTFISGTPVSFPTNSSYWDGVDPSLGSKKSREKWFDTSHFWPFPSKSTSTATLGTYPTWTGIQNAPGYGWSPNSTSDSARNGVYNDYSLWSTNNSPNFGDIRNPYTNNFDLGLRKNFDIHEGTRFQLRFDAFNALNHPLITGPNTSPGNQYFGRLSGTLKYASSNQPRAIQLGGKIYF